MLNNNYEMLYTEKQIAHIYIYIFQRNLVIQRKVPKCIPILGLLTLYCAGWCVCVCVCLRVREHHYLLKDILRYANDHVHDQSHIQCFLKLQRDGVAGHSLHTGSCH